MEIIKSQKSMCSYLSDLIHWNALEIVLLDESKYIRSHCFKNHADMFAIWTVMLEVVYQLDHPRERFTWKKISVRTLSCSHPFRVFVVLGSLGKQFNLIIGCFGVVWCTFLNLHCHIPGLWTLQVQTQQDCGK